MYSKAVWMLLAASSVASATDFSRAEAAYKTLQGWYNRRTGLWDTCGWWNGANCMTAIADLAAIDPLVRGAAIGVFANTYYNAPASNPNPQVSKTSVNGLPVSHYGAPNGNVNLKEPDNVGSLGNAIGFVDTCYDDDGWWALAWMYAYDLTGNPNYISTAQGIFNIMSTGGPTKCGGGIYWCNNNNYVNAIANELYLAVAAHLANRVPAYNRTMYVNAAVKQWNWFKSAGFFNKQGTINDGLTDDCKNNNATVWTYNQGVVLGGLAELYRANGDRTLLAAANSIAQAAITQLTDSNRVLTESCDASNSCGPDGSQFKGIFIRNLARLNKVSPNPLYATVIQNSANSIWNNDRRAANGSFSLDWSGPYINPANASTHSSAMEAIVAQAALS